MSVAASVSAVSSLPAVSVIRELRFKLDRFVAAETWGLAVRELVPKKDPKPTSACVPSIQTVSVTITNFRIIIRNDFRRIVDSGKVVRGLVGAEAERN